MDFLQQPAIRAVSTFVFLVTALALLDVPRAPALLGCLLLIPFALTRLRAFACGAAFGLMCWAVHAHTGQTLVKDSARHAVYAHVEVTDFRRTPSGSVGEGVLRELNGQATDLNVRLLGDDIFPPGTLWKGAAQVEVLSGPWSLDTTDSKWLAERRGGGLVLRMTATHERLDPPLWRWPQRALFDRRNATETRILDSLADPWRGIALALATGNKAWLDEELAQEFVDTGTSHVLAISGLHFGVVAAIAWWLSTWVARRSVRLLLTWGESRVAAVGTLGFASAYVVFVGAPASACRAWVVVLCVCLGHLAYRKPCSVHAIAWGAATALAWDPLQVFDFGFQLSFAATLGIVLFSRGTPSFLRKPLFGEETQWRRATRWVGTFVGVSWAANLATMPVLLAQTGAMPMSSFLTNLVVVPWVSVIVFPVFMAGLAIGHIWAPGMWLAGASIHCLVLLEPGLAWCAHHAANLWVPGVPPKVIIALMIATAFAFLARPSRTRLALVGLVLLGTYTAPPDFRLTFLDVGQGDSTLVQLGDTVILVDAGGRKQGPDVGRTRVLPALRRAGVGNIDYLIVTHPDLDHSGGVGFVLRHSSVSELVVHQADLRELAALTRLGVPTRAIADTARLREGVRILAPPLHSRNDRSLIVEIIQPTGTALLTGDMEEAAERWWLKQPGPKRFDVVKVPHHGSKTSSTDVFTRATAPTFAVVSAGRNNRFGHPSQSVVSRWTRWAQVLSTQQLGAVEFSFDPQHLRLRTSRGP